MKSKNSKLFVCNECGEEFSSWQGKCGNCGSWNSLKEFKIKISNRTTGELNQTIKLSKVNIDAIAHISTGSSEFDKTLSGGLIEGSITLIGGEPGIGKSTLMLQVAHAVSGSLYISGEESTSQISLRARRLKLDLDRISVLTETDVNNISKIIEKTSPRLVIIDSIQTIYQSDYPSTPGSLVQVRECGLYLQKIAKITGIPIILVGHVTKEGAVAGPKILEHLVDTVCYLEGKEEGSIRIIRTIKHRFGSTNEIGIFTMTEGGLKSLENPSSYFIGDRQSNEPGTALSAFVDANRPFIVEVQALLTKSYLNYPKRLASGIDAKRLDMLIAIITRNFQVKLYEYDIFINITGGLNIKDPGIDLAIAVAILSALKNKAIDKDIVIFGEVGLVGEIRKARYEEIRVKEVKRLGLKPTFQFKKLAEVAQNLKLFGGKNG